MIILGHCRYVSPPSKSKCVFRTRIITAIFLYKKIIYKNLNANKHVDSLFIDLKKSDNTVQHEILLDELECYSVRETMLNWFGSYPL